MATLTLQGDNPGKARGTPAIALGGRVIQLASYVFDFDNSYPAGGEDISGIWSDFKDVLQIDVQQRLYTAATGKTARVDMTGRKILLYDNAAAPAEVAPASDQSTVTGVRLLVYGYR